MSNRSSTSRDCRRVLRSITVSACPISGGRSGLRRMTCVQPRIALRGVLSSCETSARMSSFARLAHSASSRAARSVRMACSAERWARSSSSSVPPAVGGIEYRDAGPGRSGFGRVATSAVHEHGQGRPFRALQLEGELVRITLHLQQGSDVCFVINAAGKREQLLKSGAVQHRFARIARPGQKSRVDLDDLAAGERDDVSAGGIFEKFFGALLEDRGRPGRVHGRTAARNDLIAPTVSLGALRWGQ